MKENNAATLMSRYRGAVMGLAALWIFFFHEWQPILAHIPSLSFHEAFLKRIGYGGVDIFLFLSGIGLVYSIGKTSLGMFYYKRLKRLLLPFLVVAILRLIMENWSLATFLGNISGVNFYTKSMYSFLWFVPAITTFYLLFPLYYALFSRVRYKTVMTAAALSLWLILTLVLRDHIRPDLFGFTNRIPVFLLGIHTGWVLRKRKPTMKPYAYPLLILLLAGGITTLYLTNYRHLPLLVPTPNCCIPTLLVAVPLPLLLVKLFSVLETTRGLRVIGRPITAFFSFFGLFSLEFYCIQEWLGGWLLPILNLRFSTLLANLLLFAATVGAALLVYVVQVPLWKGVDALIARIRPGKSAQAA